MPRCDGTGPNGEGPMLGCRKNSCTNPRRNQRRINCMQRAFNPSKETLLNRKEALQEELQDVNEQLNNM